MLRIFRRQPPVDRSTSMDQFTTCTKAQLRGVARLAEQVKVDQGEILVREGRATGSSSSSSPGRSNSFRQVDWSTHSAPLRLLRGAGCVEPRPPQRHGHSPLRSGTARHWTTCVRLIGPDPRISECLVAKNGQSVTQRRRPTGGRRRTGSPQR